VVLLPENPVDIQVRDMAIRSPRSLSHSAEACDLMDSAISVLTRSVAAINKQQKEIGYDAHTDTSQSR
jgi:hypothetical protein